MRIAVEAGGTFTDLVAVDAQGRLVSLKVPSTPLAPQDAILSAIDQLGWPLDAVQELLHGSTVATNALLERRGAKTVLVTTSGFRDLLDMGRHQKPDIYDLSFRRRPPLVATANVLLADERVGGDAQIVRPVENLDEIVAELVRRHQAGELESVAVALLNAHRNGANELVLRDAIAGALPSLPLALSSDIAPEMGEYERASTTVTSAFVGPVVARYLSQLSSVLKSRCLGSPLRIMQSNGGTASAAFVASRAVNMLLSGPAAGVVGAVRAAAQARYEDLITFDIGGTSTDVCLVKCGRPTVTTEGEVDGVRLSVPMMDVLTIGAGGGSIAWIDASGQLEVGPQSAGAVPGPACFGKGGMPTLTDSHVLRGLMRPGRSFGGGGLLDVEAARDAFTTVAKALGQDHLLTAEDVYRLANANMARAVRLITVERGVDPRDFTLVAYGGGGGMHACAIAEDLGMRRVLIPPLAGLLSAFGLLASDLRRDGVAPVLRPVDQLHEAELEAGFASLVERLSRDLPRVDLVERSLDIRYMSQSHALAIAYSPGRLDHVRDAFEDAYQRAFGHVRKDAKVEVVNQRVVLSVRSEPPQLPRPAGSAALAPEAGEIFAAGRWRRCDFYVRDRLPVGFSAVGPLVVEESSTTSFIPDGWRLQVHSSGSIVVHSDEGQ